MSSRVPTARSERHIVGFLAFAGILLAFGIDSSLPAFDDLRTAFGLSSDSNRITLVVTWYFFGTAVGQLVYGPISDRFGRMPALRVGMAVYCLGAIGCIVAPSLGWLFASRFVWGLGAASPGVLRAAIARDLYSGDRMARLISIYMGVFLMGPVLAPLVGQGILAVGSWEWVFGVALILALVFLIWIQVFGETLDPSMRRPLDFGATVRGFRQVFTTRESLGATLALTFGFGGFIVYLGSSQPVIADIYGRGDQFALWFGAAGILMAIGFFTVNPFIDRFGTHAVAVGSSLLALSLSALLLLVSMASGGVAPFWTWLLLVGFANVFITLLTPTCYALGLEPMGELAGTASAVMGFVSTAGGSALAALVDASIDTTVTPMAVGYVAYVGIALGCLVWARPGVNRARPSSSRTPLS